MATDNTSPTAAGNVNADPDPSNGVATYYATADVFNTYGSPGMVLATVNPNQRATRSICGENFCAFNGQTLWVNATDAVYMRRDGVITY